MLQLLVLVAPVVFLPVLMLLAWVERVVPVERIVPGVPPDELP